MFRYKSINHFSGVWEKQKWNMPDSSVLHYLLEFVQIHVHRVSDAIEPSHPLPPSSFVFSLSQHQDLFQWVSSLSWVAKVLDRQLQHQSFQWIFCEELVYMLAFPSAQVPASEEQTHWVCLSSRSTEEWSRCPGEYGVYAGRKGMEKKEAVAREHGTRLVLKTAQLLFQGLF